MNVTKLVTDIVPIEDFIKLANQLKIDLRKREDKMRFSDLIKLIEDGKQPKVIEETYKNYPNRIYNWDEKRFAYVDLKNGVELFETDVLEETIKYSTFKIIRDKEILDKEEKEYLGNIIKPFRDKINCITKYRLSNNKFYIHIDHKNCYIDLPSFEASTNMYKNMECYKDYSLEDLGL